INKQALDSLPADLQAIVESAARAANQNMLDEYTARNNAALIELVETHGVQVKKLPDDVLAELQRISAIVVDEMAAENPLAQRITDSMRAFAQQSKAYHGISEEAYYEARGK
ncbi:ABC transporter substrate-binding protein, partial [Porticoccaceae bacterium]|nr:ABC transporter substrate-binding protein [Porticoccaceae bacterium]